ncbi:MAG: preprotein translocase subunit SecG [Clostridia bacterium]|nr:preprotein translocase subunit SecG [Clostridia bacterium]
MGALEITLGIVLIVMSLILSIAVLAQTGKDKKLSGAIGGSAETFFGKNKGNRWDSILAKGTIVCSVIFVILVIVMYVIV